MRTSHVLLLAAFHGLLTIPSPFCMSQDRQNGDFETRKARRGTLKWVSQVFLENPSGGAQGALSALEEFTQAGTFAPYYSPYHVIQPEQGEVAWRTDMKTKGNADEEEGGLEDMISYNSFSPPALWGAPYSILRAEFPAREISLDDKSQTFMFHRGEELLIPTHGAVNYRFFWTPGGRLPKPEDIETPLTPGSIIRINPQIPHDTWATEGERAKAWMIFRDASDSATSISVDPTIQRDSSSKDPKIENRSSRDRPRRKTLKDLQNPTSYALTAWNIAESIRLQRERADLEVKQLARFTGVDAAKISRIERLEAPESASLNISIDALIRISEFLHIPLSQIIREASWRCEVGDIEQPGPVSLVSEEAVMPYYLQTEVRHFPNGKHDISESSEEWQYRSWIVLAGGRALVGNDVVRAGSVVHFSSPCKRTISMEAIDQEPLKVLQVTYAPRNPWLA